MEQQEGKGKGVKRDEIRHASVTDRREKRKWDKAYEGKGMERRGIR